MTEEEKQEKLTVLSGEVRVPATQEIGEVIHREAMKREKQAREDRIIYEVQRLEEARLDYARKADFAIKAVDWYRRKLEAVRKGEFDFDLPNAQMIFHDPEFRKANY